MADLEQGHHGYEEAEFEHEDLGAKPILWFLGGLAVVMLALHLALTCVYGLMNRHDQAHQPAMNPLKPAGNADTRAVTKEDVAKFPQPRLEENERLELRDVLLKQDETLATYGWTDEKAGVVRIPIERAMELTAQRGLPVQAKTGTVPASPVNTAREAAARSDRSRAGQKAAAKKRK